MLYLMYFYIFTPLLGFWHPGIFFLYKHFSLKTQSCVTLSAERRCSCSDHSVCSLMPNHCLCDLCVHSAKLCVCACVNAYAVNFQSISSETNTLSWHGSNFFVIDYSKW